MKALPSEVLVNNAGLLVAANYLQHVALGGQPDRFEHDQRLAIIRGSAAGPLREQLILLTGTSAAARTAGNFTEARDAAAEARRRVDAALADPAAAAELEAIRGNLPHLYLQWGRSLELADGAGTVYEYEEAHRIALQTNQPQVARRAVGHLAWHQIISGRSRQAAHWLEQATATGAVNPRYDAVNHLAAALILLEQQDHDGAGRELARMRAFPVGEYWAAAVWVRALHATTAADAVLAENELLEQLERQPPALAGGSNGRLLRAAQLHLGFSGRLGSDTSGTVSAALLDAAAAYQRGDYHEALEESDSPARAGVPPRIRGYALVIAAASALALQRRATAYAYFEQAYAILHHEGLTTPYTGIAAEHLDELARATIGTRIQVKRGPRALPSSAVLGSLTKREREVLALLATPASFAAIAAELFISANTIKSTTQRLYRKLGISSRRAAADIAHRAGLVRPQR
ncbi:hypothetical protein GCM10022287_01280 [Gryllotalpicola koreensis]|uniref:HTH luxR-type domain-containing protein n=1 Tax=Gryllotalpicola koreensis TaxID=993086 RepID=A0ABP7ZPW6_9MICO